QDQWGTRFMTWREGERVGTDEAGNVYYRSRGGKKHPALGHERRWVVFNGEAEASRVPPGWAGWLQHTVDTPPSFEAYVPREWEKPHVPNLTGSMHAYRPKGSAALGGERQKTGGDYDAWRPGEAARPFFSPVPAGYQQRYDKYASASPCESLPRPARRAAGAKGGSRRERVGRMPCR
ncbi:NADH:ubiquinone oxidoreductase subunit NDUFA12, partial [Candidatus Gracilibacteria bacterium]|nr:NADH:ubiquinone oxidoreductase subunit NDUFA12 [Candidatus Gracilibacteria bacterium]